MTSYAKPLPEPSPLTEPFWQAARDRKLVVQWCEQCDEWMFYPREVCPACLEGPPEWRQVSGRGEVFSYTVVRQPMTAGFEADAPYVYAMIELEEGVRLISNVVDTDVEAVEIGMPVAVTFVEATAEITLPLFKPSPSAR